MSPARRPKRDELAAEFLGRAVMAEALVGFARDHLIAHEGFGALLQFDEFGGDRKVHGGSFPYEERGRPARIEPKSRAGRPRSLPFASARNPLAGRLLAPSRSASTVSPPIMRWPSATSGT